MTVLEKIEKLFNLPWNEKCWMGALIFASFIAWLALKAIPMRKLSTLMGFHLENRQLCTLASKDQRLTALRMGHIMSSVSNHVPWQCRCLSEALCVKWMLGLYAIPSVFYLGASLDEPTGMKAHAWITVGHRTIVGGPQHFKYNVVATFTTPDFS